jgi:hypothetical protein
MASGGGGSGFVSFVVGALVAVVALMGVAVYMGYQATGPQLTMDMSRPTLPSIPR